MSQHSKRSSWCFGYLAVAIVAVFFASMADSSAQVIIGTGAPPLPCDTECRVRRDFFFCVTGPGVATCLTYDAYGTCILCQGPSGACGSVGSSGGSCVVPLGGTESTAWYWTGCNPACSCSNKQSVEADTGGRTNDPVSLPFRECRVQ